VAIGLACCGLVECLAPRYWIVVLIVVFHIGRIVARQLNRLLDLPLSFKVAVILIALGQRTGCFLTVFEDLTDCISFETTNRTFCQTEPFRLTPNHK